MRPHKDLHGLSIEIEALSDHFIIKDNCGGIESEIARNYAFRFGRPKDKPIQSGSVGQFGIGMKRSLFKMGKFFEIDSIASKSSFKMEVDVDKWQNNQETWDFEFKIIKEELSNPVELKNLNKGYSSKP
ncbi:MAG: ATP-binding protein [Bacteroidetes bacterium]|nr:ATP-binding protein [Bacteroidota bacterium]